MDFSSLDASDGDGSGLHRSSFGNKQSENRRDVIIHGGVWSGMQEEVLEQVLARLPVTALIRNRLVCKRWSSLSFLHSLLRIRSLPRPPWLYLAASTSTSTSTILHHLLYDTELRQWRRISPPSEIRESMIPAAAACGLICFVCAKAESSISEFLLYNPITNRVRRIGVLDTRNVFAVSMRSVDSHDDSGSFEILALCAEAGDDVSVRVYSSSNRVWSRGLLSLSENNNASSSSANNNPGLRNGTDTRTTWNADGDGDGYGEGDTVYYLDEEGQVVAFRAVRGGGQRYGSGRGELRCCMWEGDVAYFLSASAGVVALNARTGQKVELPAVLPLTVEHAVDLVMCGGRLLAVVMADILDTCSIGVWQFRWDLFQWTQLCAPMPPAMCHRFRRMCADLRCCTSPDGRFLFACVVTSVSSPSSSLPPAASPALCSVFLLNLQEEDCRWHQIWAPFSSLDDADANAHADSAGVESWPWLSASLESVFAFCFQPSCVDF